MSNDLIYTEIQFKNDQVQCMKVFYYNSVYIGEFYKEVDGFYVFDPDRTHSGYWDASVLHAIAQKLDELNASIEEELRKYFDEH